jgi:hypothetical protein
MARDDYFVVVYKILKYLYGRLRQGKAVNVHYLSHDGEDFNIPQSYWNYIIRNLTEYGYVSGAKFFMKNGEELTICVEEIKITPKGIEYLQNSPMIAKAVANIQGFRSMKHLNIKFL